jgi:UPF0755 protein
MSAENKTMTKRQKYLGLLSVSSIIIIGFIGFVTVKKIGVPPTIAPTLIQVSNSDSFDDLVQKLQENNILHHPLIFRWLAKRMYYEGKKVRPGQFKIQPGWTLIELLKHLRWGENIPVKLVLTNARLKEEVVGKITEVLPLDSIELMQKLSDEHFLNQMGFTEDNVISLFIPNTYLIYWNTTTDEFIERMKTERLKFWKLNDRISKAQSLNLSPEEVYTLASIIEKETQVNSEKSTMAGVYLNRLRIGMPLQADPTAVFARRDFLTKRVTYYHIKYEHPYNTYLNKGLPPGPICMPSISSIDAVLNPEEHDFLYFCAVGDESGTHSFAKNMSGHQKNISVYKENLRKRGLLN